MKSRLVELRANGFNRLYQHEQIFEFSSPESLLDLDFSLPVFVLIDRIVVSPENRARIVDAAEIAYREGGEVIYEEVPREELPDGAERPRHRFSTAYECRTCHKSGPRTGAAPLLLQQSLRRLPALPGLRQHHRFRPEPGHSRQVSQPQRRRHRSLEPPQISHLVHRPEAAGKGFIRPHGRSLAGSDRRSAGDSALRR